MILSYITRKLYKKDDIWEFYFNKTNIDTVTHTKMYSLWKIECTSNIVYQKIILNLLVFNFFFFASVSERITKMSDILQAKSQILFLENKFWLEFHWSVF